MSTDEQKTEQTKPAIRKGTRYLKVFFCHGCQSCWDVNDKDELEESEHVLSVEDVTEQVEALFKKETENGNSKSES